MAWYHKDRKKRLRDFQRVWAKNAYHSPYGDFWNVHPFADEEDFLLKIAMKPEDCQSVDLWWRFEVDVALVTIQSNCKEKKLILDAGGQRRPYPIVFADITKPFISFTDVPDLLSQALQRGISKRSYLKRFRKRS